MAKIKMNYNSKAIEISEAFAKNASVYGSKAYKELKEIQQNNPGYSVTVIREQKTKAKNLVKGLTIEIMRKYVEKHNEDNFLEKFDELVENKTSYFSIKVAVLKHYPKCKEYTNTAEWIMAV